MGANPYKKGSKNERVASKEVDRWTKKKFARVPRSGGLGWKTQNSVGDIICVTEGHFCPFTFECKAYEELDFSHLLRPDIKNADICKFWAQAKGDALKINKVPILMMRYNGLPKSFFFLGIPYKFYRQIKTHIPNNHAQMRVNISGELVTFLDSRQFFSSDYKTVRKIAKAYVKQ
jgi:hypothetical protein